MQKDLLSLLLCANFAVCSSLLIFDLKEEFIVGFWWISQNSALCLIRTNWVQQNEWSCETQWAFAFGGNSCTWVRHREDSLVPVSTTSAKEKSQTLKTHHLWHSTARALITHQDFADPSSSRSALLAMSIENLWRSWLLWLNLNNSVSPFWAVTSIWNSLVWKIQFEKSERMIYGDKIIPLRIPTFLWVCHSA